MKLANIMCELEEYVTPLFSSEYISSLNMEENKFLALQNVHRLNQQIGRLARRGKEQTAAMRALQTIVNGLTIGIKANNVQQMKNGLNQARYLISRIE